MLNQPEHRKEFESTSSGYDNLQIEVDNPFPGLRPFSLEECHLFFGREGQIDEILNQIAQNRFVTVMGYSGSGKSSLMACGLVPVLYGGFVTESGPHWNVISTRPGSSPINALVESIIEFMIQSNRIEMDDASIHRSIISSVLRSGPEGLVEVSRYLQTELSENVFILVDQFEEVFRHQENTSEGFEAQNEAQLYVNLILTAVRQVHTPVYVALTMRSDFIGECASFPGLTQKINNSNYLVPQMSREQKKMVIEGPVAVAGGKISPRLVKRLMSDMGNDQDQLPILQHALMRTWDNWIVNREPGEPMDIRHYNAIGRIEQALSQHANEAFDELSTRDKAIAEVLFKNVTEKNQDNRGMRRACRLGMVAQLAEASEDEVIHVVEQFRKSGRSFLMPAAHIPLTADSMIELSHESLMRIWNRLELWVDDEAESASMYRRLSDAAAMYQIGKTGLWRPPDLQLALNWQKKQKPTREWAQRYDEAFERAIVFLDTSRITYEAELKNQEMMQKRVLRRTRATAIILGIAFLVAILFFVFAYLQKIEADEKTLFAEQQQQEAQRQKEEAKIQQERAEEQTKIVNQQKERIQGTLDELEKQRTQLAIALNEAEAARNQAITNLQLANEQRDSAFFQRNRATYESSRALRSLKTADSLYMLTKAQELASKAAVQDDDKNLAGLMAMQGYVYHRRFYGRKYDPFIYNGLYSALTKLSKSGANYNAMKIMGPPRVHMTSLVVFEKGNDFMSAGADGRIYRGDYEKLTNAATDYSTPYPSKVIALSKDEKYLVNGNDSSFVQIYTLNNGKKPRVVRGLKGASNDIEFLPDNSGFIVASSGKTLTKINQQSGESSVLMTLPYELKAIDIHPNGKMLAGASWTGQVVLINLQTNAITILVDDNSLRVLSVHFSSSGKYLAYGVEDVPNVRGLVKLYDFATKQTRQFTGHRAGVYDVEFSQDEKLLASAGLDKRLQLYVLENPDDLPVVMDNNNGFVWDITFAKGADYLIAACSESEIRVWPTDPAVLAEKICPQLTRNMSQDEWKKYVGNKIDYENTCVRLLIKDY